ncbi:Dynein heavy chain family protein [Trichomonas vaginalis G3]|uniref:Dynein heavy chain family protein n=1 Tax=Trichomonas vaginalis (strain ATCC PRA-98 / G3) TaxID=412133 RepID=A2DL85_TRIV3|nr:dynein heavy chain family protein family [Trichomonas vaginalis G3]EAY18876.1 Dynein heavy chain family protein [Trichomonas vaginalis G3]KAI5526005.1 dynein heavy chain family protein family [Trichomonas vaginalis G3]|eukprot:XP_001579862.1 Dynein heavy chain family protein [Trichomonas vaginalis G3]
MSIPPHGPGMDRSRELKSRLVPRQQLISKPVTLGSCFGTNRPKTRAATRPEIQQKPIHSSLHTPRTPKKLEQLEPEISLIPDNFEDPLEFINYVKKYNITNNFVYLYPSKLIEDENHPTSLKIIPPSQVKRSEFWTLSLKGLTHVCGDEVDFQELDEWLDANKKFAKLIQLPFFRYQRQWRHFRAWKSLVQTSKVKHANMMLTQNLFFTDLILRDAFLKVQRKLSDLQNLKLFSLRSTGKYRMKNFIEDNHEHYNKTTQMFSELYNYICQTVNEACEKTRELLHSPEKSGKTKGRPLELLMEHYKKTHSITKEKENENKNSLEYTNRANYRATCNKLIRFIHLIDYVVISALRNLCFDSTMTYLSIFQILHERGAKDFDFVDPEYQKPMKLPIDFQKFYDLVKQRTKELFDTPIFWIDMSFDDTIKWNPNESEIIEKLDIIRNDFIDLLFKVPRLLTNPLFGSILGEIYGEDALHIISIPDLGRIIFNDSVFKTITQEQVNIIHSEFHLLNFYNETFSEPFSIYNNEQSIDLTFLDNPNLTANNVADKIKGLRTEEKFLKSIVESKNVGIFYCVSTDMKKSLIMSPGVCIRSIKLRIPHVIERYLEEFNRHIKEAHRDLSIIVNNVPTYVEFIDVSNKYNSLINSFVDEQNNLQQFFQLAQDQSITVSEEDKELFNDLSPILEQIKVVLANSSSQIQSQKAYFTVQLDEYISNLHESMKSYKELETNPKLEDQTTTNNEAAAILVVLIAKANAARDLSKKYNLYRQKMDLAPVEFNDVNELCTDVANKQLLWETKTLWDSRINQLFVMNFVNIDPDALKDEIKQFKDNAYKTAKALIGNQVADTLVTAIIDVSNLLPVIADLKNPSFTIEHKTLISNLLGTDIFSHDVFTLHNLFDIHAFNYVEQIHAISVQATNERILLENITKVQKDIDALYFGCHAAKWQKSSYEICEFNEVTEQLENAKATIDSVRASPYVAPLRQTAGSWNKTIKMMLHITHLLRYVQDNWIFIQSIFPSGLRPTPADSKELSSVEKIWRTLSTKINDDPAVAKISALNQTAPDLESAKDSVQKLLKSINDNLDSKRINFMRFYFLSNNQLASIISRSKEPTCIVEILPQIFDGIRNVEIVPDNHIPCVKSLINASGEVFEVRSIKFRSNIDSWLKNIEETSKRNLKSEVKVSMQQRNEMTHEDWIKSHLSQIVRILIRIDWTNRVLLCFQTGNAVESLKVFKNEIDRYILTYCQELKTSTNNLDILKLSSLITLRMYHRDTIERYIKDEVFTQQHYQWFRQVKFTYEEQTKDVKINVGSCSYVYDNEFADCNARTVMTEDSEKDFFSMTSSLHHSYGVSTVGEHCSGKTETLKMISRTLGRFMYILNCSNFSSIKEISMVFKGSLLANVWLCYKHADNLPMDSIAILTDYFRSLFNASQAQQKKVDLLGFEITMPQNYGIFLTFTKTNDALPDSLHSFFRPTYIRKPPLRLYCESCLWSLGFQNAKELSEKVINILRDLSVLFEEKKIVVLGYELIKRVMKFVNEFKNRDLKDEQIIANSIQCAINSGIKDEKEKEQIDKTLLMYFNEPHSPNFDEIHRREIATELRATLKDLKFNCTHLFIDKIINVRSQYFNNRGVILYGPSCTGKSTALKILRSHFNMNAKVVNDDNKIQQVYIISIYNDIYTLQEMLGYQSKSQGQFYDGFLTKSIKSANDHRKHKVRWFVFDGTMADKWCESIESLIYDKPILNVDDGDQVFLNDNFHFFFETTDISRISPAFVSRCGLVYFDNNQFIWDSFVDGQKYNNILPLFKNQNLYINVFSDLCDRSLENAVHFSDENGSPTKDVPSLSHVSNFFKIFIHLIEKLNFTTSEKVVADKMTAFYIFAFYWAFGGHLDNSRRQLFDKMARDCFTNTIDLPMRGTLFEWWYDSEQNSWTNWQDLVPKYVDTNDSFTIHPQSIMANSIMIPTVETERVNRLFKLYLESGLNILLRGPPGSGKTTIKRNFTRNLEDERKLQIMDVECTKSFPPSELMKFMHRCMGLKKKSILYGSGAVKRCLVLDDIHNLEENDFGEKPIIEFLRQISEQNGSFFTPKNMWTTIEDLVLLGVGNDDSSTHKNLNARFTKTAITYQLSINSTAIFNILHSLMKTFFLRYEEPVIVCVPKIINGTLYVYEQISLNIFPTQKRPHYTFNMHDINNLLFGILRCSSNVIKTSNDLELLWVHEMDRSFGDKFLPEDKPKYEEYLSNALKNKLNSTQSLRSFQVPMFCYSEYKVEDYNPEYGTLPDYNLFNNINDLTQLFISHVEKYQIPRRIADEKLVIFNDISVHIIRANRVLNKPLGNLLLLGQDGSGRHTCAKIAASIANMEYLELTSGLSFRDEMKQALPKAISGGKGYCISITEEMLLKPEISRDVTYLLTNNGLMMMFSPVEFDALCVDAVRFARLRGENESYFNLSRILYDRFAENFHLIIYLDPKSPNFLQIIQNNPAIIRHCTVDNYEQFNIEGMMTYANKTVLERTQNQQLSNQISKLCIDTFNFARQYISDKPKILKNFAIYPSIFMKLVDEFLNRYEKLYVSESEEISKLKTIVELFNELQETVQGISQKVQTLNPEIENRKSKLQRINTELVSKQKEVSNIANDIKMTEEEMKKNLEEAEKIRRQHDAELNDYITELYKSVARLKSLTKTEINDMRSANPPLPITKSVMEIVCVLMEVEPTWPNSVSLLNDPLIVPKLTTMYSDKNPVTEIQLSEIVGIIEKNKLFKKDIALRETVGCQYFLSYIKSLIEYQNAVIRLTPTQHNLHKLQSNIEQTRSKLSKVHSSRTMSDKNIELLKEQMSKEDQEISILAQQVQENIQKEESGKEIINMLIKEHDNWKGKLNRHMNYQSDIVGDSFIITVALLFASSFTQEQREEFLSQVRRIVRDARLGYSLINSSISMITPLSEAAQWRKAGLIDDDEVLENFIYLMNAPYSPYVIDPSGMVFNVVKMMEEKKQAPIVTKLELTNYLRILESAMRAGSALFVTDVRRSVPYCYEAVMARKLSLVQDKSVVRLADRTIEIDIGFHLYLFTKFIDQKLSQTLCTRATVVNFAPNVHDYHISMKHSLMKVLKPELISKISDLSKSIDTEQTNLAFCQQRIQDLLSNTDASTIIEDNILFLELAKQQDSIQTLTKLVENYKSELKTIKESTDFMDAPSKRLAILTELTKNLKYLNPLYVFGKVNFHYDIKIAMKNMKEGDDLMEVLTYAFYKATLRSVFSEYRFIVSFLFSSAIMMGSGLLDQSEFDIFVSGFRREQSVFENPIPQTMTNEMWCDIQTLASHVKPMKNLPRKIMSEYEDFQTFLETKSDTLPEKLQQGLTEFQTIILFKVIAPQHVAKMMHKFVSQNLNERYVKVESTGLEDIIELPEKVPILIMTKAFATSFFQLQTLARQKRTNLRCLSLPHTKASFVETTLNFAMQGGDWLLLEAIDEADMDVQLTVSALVTKLKTVSSRHPTFRLFITVAREVSIPLNILTDSVRLAVTGISMPDKMLLELINWMPEDIFGKKKSTRIAFLIAVFHTAFTSYMMKYSKSSIHLSNVPFFDSMQTLLNLHYALGTIPLSVLKEGIIELNYSGHLVEEDDLKMFKLIVDQMFTEEIADGKNPITIDGKVTVPNGDTREFCVNHAGKFASIVYNMFTRDLSNGDESEEGEITTSLKKIVENNTPPPDISLAIECSKSIMQSLSNIDIQNEKKQDEFSISIQNEAEFYSNVVKNIRQSCEEIIGVDKGSFTDLLVNYDDMLQVAIEKVPKSWQFSGQIATNYINHWINNLNERIDFINTWMRKGRPQILDLSAFHDAKPIFLCINNYLANIRKIKLPQLVVLATLVPENAADFSASSIYMQGAELQNVFWDMENKCLENEGVKKNFLIKLYSTDQSVDYDSYVSIPVIVHGIYASSVLLRGQKIWFNRRASIIIN